MKIYKGNGTAKRQARTKCYTSIPYDLLMNGEHVVIASRECGDIKLLLEMGVNNNQIYAFDKDVTALKEAFNLLDRKNEDLRIMQSNNTAFIIGMILASVPSVGCSHVDQTFAVVISDEVPPQEIEPIMQALNEWSNRAGVFFTVTVAHAEDVGAFDRPTGGVITIRWDDVVGSHVRVTPAERTSLARTMFYSCTGEFDIQRSANVWIMPASFYDPTVCDASTNGCDYNYVRRLMLHETGHALGLLHSKDDKDIMFWSLGSAEHLSDSDIQLEKEYSL